MTTSSSSTSTLLSSFTQLIQSHSIPLTSSSSSSLRTQTQERDSSSSTITASRQDTPTVTSLAALKQKLKLGLNLQVQIDPTSSDNAPTYDGGLTDSPATSTAPMTIPTQWRGDKEGDESENWIGISDAAGSFADACRQAELFSSRPSSPYSSPPSTVPTSLSSSLHLSGSPRTPLGQSNLPTLLSQSLSLSISQSSTNPQSSTLQSISTAQTSLLRSIANLCIDHDLNREAFLKLGTDGLLIKLLNSFFSDLKSTSKDSRLPILNRLKTCLGSLLNLQMDHKGIKSSLLSKSLESGEESDFFSCLLRIGNHDTIYRVGEWCPSLSPSQASSVEILSLVPTITQWSWRILTEILTPVEGSTPETPSEDGVFETSDSESGDQENEISELIKKVKAKGSEKLEIRELILEPLIGFLRSRNEGHSDLKLTSEEVDDLIDVDAEILSNCSELWEGISEVSGKTFKVGLLEPLSSSQDSNGLKILMDFLEFSKPPSEWYPAGSVESCGRKNDSIEPPSHESSALENIKSFSQYKSSIGRALCLIVSEDSLSPLLFNLDKSDKDDWFTSRCLSWISRKDREDLTALGILNLGNLARKDENCIELLNSTSISTILRDLLESFLVEMNKFSSLVSNSDSNIPNAPKPSTSLSSPSLKTLHSILGLLKNLSIPQANKPKLLKLNLISTISTLTLGKGMDQIQPVQFFGIGVLKNLCVGDGIGGFFLTSEEGVQEQPLDRVLGLISRTEDLPTRLEGTRILVNSIKGLWSASANQNITQEQISKSKEAFTQTQVVSCLTEMLVNGIKYPILINEAMIALTLLASGDEGSRMISISLSSNSQTLMKSEDSTPTPTKNGLSILTSILERTDSRIPIEFATNACSLILALSNASKLEGEGEEALRKILETVSPSLESLDQDVNLNQTEVSKIAGRALESCGKRLKE